MIAHPYAACVFAELAGRERLAEATRYRLAAQAQPHQPGVKDVLTSVLRTLHTIARGTLRPTLLRTFGARDKAPDRAVLSVAR